MADAATGIVPALLRSPDQTLFSSSTAETGALAVSVCCLCLNVFVCVFASFSVYKCFLFAICAALFFLLCGCFCEAFLPFAVSERG